MNEKTDTKEEIPLRVLLQKAGKEALGGGIPGMVAMSIQVSSLMWLRTTLNYQYRYGGTMTEAMSKLYKEGGIRRFYQGYLPALVQAPLSRFGDTAANAGILSIFENTPQLRELPIMVKTVACSLSAALFRIFLMPVDTLKTMMQVEGSAGVRVLQQKVSTHGMKVLYNGSLASSVATFAGHYPWFATYNYLTSILPTYKEKSMELLKNAGIGFTASMISDSVSNSLRVIKTTRQTAATNISYQKAIQIVLEKDGLPGLFGRGLKTKILSNGVQGLMFSVLWKLGKDYYKEREAKEKEL